MIVLLSLTQLIFGILTSTVSPLWTLGLAILLLLSRYVFNIGKTGFLLMIVFFIIGVVRPLLYIPGKVGSLDTVGFVYKAEENYFLVATMRGNYYVNEAGYELGDLIKVEGISRELSFKHYESGFNFKEYLNRSYVHHEIVNTSSSFIIKNPLRINAYRSFVLSYITNENKTLVSGFLFGDSLGSLSSFSNLSDLGVTRFFTLSGMHVSLVLKLIKDKMKSTRIKSLLTILINISFLLLTSFKFAAIRIVLTTIMRCYFKKKSIEVPRLTVTFFLAISLLIFNANYIFDLGFIYTFMILIFLELMNPLLKKSWSQKKLKSYFLCSLILLPINIYRTYVINPISFLIGPLILPLALIFGVLTLPLLLLPHFGMLLDPLLVLLNIALAFLGKYDLSLTVGEVKLFVIIFLYLVILLSLYLWSIKHLVLAKVCATLMMGVVIVSLAPSYAPSDYVHFIDVGQGDATLLRIKGKSYLFDTGGSATMDYAKKCLIPYFKRLRIYQLEAVFITHKDTDHFGALHSLNDNFPIKSIYFNDIKEVKMANFTVLNLNRIQLGRDDNTNSGVYYISYRGFQMMIMGDAPKLVEREILKESPSLEVDVLKVGHHGSSTSSDKEFLKVLRPKISIISCGLNNRYGHPNHETISTFQNLGLNYRRTDQSGTISLKLSRYYI